MKKDRFIIKAIPWIGLGFVFGFVILLLSNFNFNFDLSTMFTYFGYSCIGISIISMILSIYFMCSSKSMINKKSDYFDKIEIKIDNSIILACISFITCLISFGIVMYGSHFNTLKSIFSTIFTIWFIVTCFASSYIQYVCVELNKKINPEKKGNALDFNFSKDFYNSCDEAQKIIIGEVCYKSFMITSSILLWTLVALIFAASFIDIGFFTIVLVGLINIVNVLVYTIISHKLQYKGSIIYSAMK